MMCLEARRCDRAGLSGRFDRLVGRNLRLAIGRFEANPDGVSGNSDVNAYALAGCEEVFRTRRTCAPHRGKRAIASVRCQWVAKRLPEDPKSTVNDLPRSERARPRPG